MPDRRAALFDMDGTLVRINTSRLYLRWQRRRGDLTAWQALQGLLWLFQYRLGVIEISQVTRRALATLVGRNEAQFRTECEAWFQKTVTPYITDAARSEVETRREAGDALAIVTAGTDYAALPLAKELDIPHVLSTRLESRDGLLTGATDGQLCYGPEKVRAVRSWAQETGIDLANCAFYSDSITDLPLLSAVGRPVVVNPDFRLRRAATQRRWPVVRWQ